MSLAAFCKKFEIRLAKPASATALKRAEKLLGGPLPKSVVDLYVAGNGGVSKQNGSPLQFLSVEEALEYADVPGFFDSPWRLWPAVYNGDSNPWCVCCDSPLAGYIVHVRHDDGPRLMFRSLARFYSAANRAANVDEPVAWDDLPSDFETPERSRQDGIAARWLVRLAANADEDALQEEVRSDALRFACDLYSDQQLDEIQGLLEFGNAEVREHAAARLKRIPGAAANGRGKQAVSKAASEFDSFVQRCGDLLRKAGVNATVLEMYGKKTIRLDPGPIWLNMDMFYDRRRKPDCDAFLLEQVQALQKPALKRAKTKR